jgi:hypothetical protein
MKIRQTIIADNFSLVIETPNVYSDDDVSEIDLAECTVYSSRLNKYITKEIEALGLLCDLTENVCWKTLYKEQMSSFHSLD